MPTGYTGDIKDDTTFAEFAIRCARNFGATITMRDDPMDAHIPEAFEPSDHHVKALAKATAWLAELQAMDVGEIDRRMIEEQKRREADRAAALVKKRADRARYERMLKSVEAWEPPTKDHVGMKTFMRDQLTQTIAWDCDEKHLLEVPPAMTGRQWLDEKIASAAHDVFYHTKERQAEIDRAASRTAWVKALRESLAPKAAAK